MSEQYTIILGREFGLFSTFVHTIQQLYHAEAENRIPIVYWSGGIYFQKVGYNGVESRNIWDYFFEPVSDARMTDVFPWLLEQKHSRRKTIPKNKIPSNVKLADEIKKTVVGEPEHCFRDGYSENKVSLNHMSHECKIFAHNIVKKYVKINTTVQSKIDYFYNTYFQDHMLGVHLRGCGPVGLGDNLEKQFESQIREYVNKHDDCCVFMASDSSSMLHYIQKRFSDKFIFRPALRASGNSLFDINKNALHKKLSKYSRIREDRQIIGAAPAEEAIIETVLLSKCRYFLRSNSNMSSSVFFFNPYIESLFVPQYTEAQRKIVDC